MEKTIFKKMSDADRNSLYADYKEFVEACNGTISERGFEEYLYEEELDAWNRFEFMINESGYNDTAVAILGNLELWNGKYEIIPTYVDDLLSGIEECKGRNGEIEEITANDDYFEVVVLHHDGRNHFKIYLLSKEGKDNLYDDEDNFDVAKNENHLKIMTEKLA